jgi:hypothetical protein
MRTRTYVGAGPVGVPRVRRHGVAGIEDPSDAQRPLSASRSVTNTPAAVAWFIAGMAVVR